MTIADDIIAGRTPDFDAYVRMGESLDDIDEYGFTPLIQTAITGNLPLTERLVERGVDVNKPDVTGRTALHWAVDNGNVPLTRLLLVKAANPNAYTSAGLPVLAYPMLRSQSMMKNLLYQYGAKVDFALDFIYAKLLGHRFELKGETNILTAANEFIRLDYEGFILEFTVDVVQDSLRRFTSSYSTRHLRHHFPYLYTIMDAFQIAENLLRIQLYPRLDATHHQYFNSIVDAPMLILPSASSGHAMCFVRYGEWWIKIDRGENSKIEGSVNIYRIQRPQALTAEFLVNFIYKKQSRDYFHQHINTILDLHPLYTMPISSQIVGNCSWANVQASIPAAYAIQHLVQTGSLDNETALNLYTSWIEWDKDRALDESIQRFYTADSIRKASIASMLAAVLFQACDAKKTPHMERAEKILPILTLPDYYYVLRSYLEIYCVKQFTRRGNNLLKLLEDYGFDPHIGLTPIATGL